MKFKNSRQRKAMFAKQKEHYNRFKNAGYTDVSARFLSKKAVGELKCKCKYRIRKVKPKK
jgi:hypothetical protein